MNWQIYSEGPTDTFTTKVEVFVGDTDAVSDHLAELQAATGVCHSASLIVA